MSKIIVEVYSDTYKQDLEGLLIEASESIYGYGTANIDNFLDGHWIVYLAKKGDEVIGFSSYTYNTYYGLRPPTVGNTYLYVKPEYRRGRASYLLSIQSAYVSVDTDLPLETYYASDESKAMSHRMQGTLLYDAWMYEPKEMSKAYTNATKNFKVRKDQ